MKKGLIYIIEDELELSYSIDIALKTLGYETKVYNEGASALKAIIEKCENKNSPDLIITDIQIPNVSGLEIIKTINEKKFKTPFLVITGFGTKSMVTELLRLGCKDFLDKPFGLDELTKSVENIVVNETDRQSEQLKEINKMLSEKFKLTKDVNLYKKELKLLEREVLDAKKLYEDLTTIDLSNISVGFSMKREPFSYLGGDYIDIFQKDNHVHLIITDVAGHDFSAALHNIIIKSVFNEFTRDIDKHQGPDLLEMLNRALFLESESERMATGVYICIDLNTYFAKIYGCGHPPCLFLPKKCSGDCVDKIDCSGSPLGVYNNIDVSYNEFKVIPGDRLIVYTDGVVDSYNININSGIKVPLGVEGLSGSVFKNRNAKLDKLVEKTWESVLDYSKNKVADDKIFAAVEIV